ncbi:MAG: polysaccharide deacetylase family protein, partial [Ruminococcus sp.]
DLGFIMKTKVRTIIITIILLIITVICLLWAGLTVFGIDVISEAKNLLNLKASAQSVAFEHNKVTLGVGQKSDLNVVLMPADTNSTYTFTSSDDSVIKATDNKAEAVGDGECTVKVKTENDLTDYCEITVVSPPKSVSVPKKLTISLNEEYTLTPNAKEKYPASFFTFTSSNTDVATVDKAGKITAVNTGDTVITVTAYNGLTGECKVSVFKEPTSLSFADNNISVPQDSTYKLEPQFNEGEGASTLSYSSSDKKIAKVSKTGVVTGVTAGEAIITCTLPNNVTAQCTVTVENKFARIRSNLDPSKPMVALTFDDGPNGDSTLSIINTLKQYNGRATFFVVGSQVTEYPDVLKKTYDEGHEIGSHSWDHQYADSLGYKEQEQEVLKNDEAIKNILGVYPTVFRCPGGITGKYYEQCRMPLIYWSIDTVDWKTKDSNATFNAIKKVFSKGETLDGDIVLMHDIQNSTPAAVKNICKYLSKKGYQMVTISEMAYYKGVKFEGGKAYYDFYK